VRLFASYLAVVAVGIGTVLVAADLVAPRFFAGHMAGMMGGPGRMMGGGGPAVAAAALDAALEAAFRTSLLQALAVAAGAALVAAGVASLFVTDRVVGSVRRLAAASRRVAAGHYAERVPATAPAELGELAACFNEMAAALEATERRRLELIGDVAHELRTPVATLEGNLEGLLDGVVEPDAALWARLHGEAGRLRRLIDDLQELSRAEAGRIPVSSATVAPAGIARAALGRFEGQVGAGLELVGDVPSDLPAVRADPDRAVQVLTNLLANALRYTPPPGRVRLTVHPVAGAVEFAVEDTGVGIAAEHLPRVFDRFYRVDKSRSRAPGARWAGSGVGLTIARALVEAMGGSIRAASDGLGRGATFAFTLPRA
jgi:signal transduction histidine kinase